MPIDPDFWPGRRVLLTGHTGFKGAWLALWLQSLGAHICGLAPQGAAEPSIYRLARVADLISTEDAVDVRDLGGVTDALRRARPEVVFHLAAQPMVLRSLREPALTYEVNLMGTVNVLEAVRTAGADVRAVVVVTSDKCYENPPGERRAFVEGDPLGGDDPYSSSKACAELAVAAYRRSFMRSSDAPRVASARAGNVIGGGDWGEDRLMGDAVRAVEAARPLRIRRPDAVRPWQHVLSALGGYLLLAQALWASPAAARAWNFGPPVADARSVAWVVRRLGELWEGALQWEIEDLAAAPPEAGHLALDSTRARSELGWRALGTLDDDLRLLVGWHREHARGADMRAVSLAQIAGRTPR